MSKYTYTQVEHLSDLDITGDTQYYLFEEGVGHEEFDLKDMIEYTLYQLGNLIEERKIFTREEKPWYERIPKKGVLCRYVDEQYSEESIYIIKEYNQIQNCVYTDKGTCFVFTDVTPLTNHEIKTFLQEEE